MWLLQKNGPNKNVCFVDPYSGVASDHMTEWEKSREMDEFSKSAKIFRPMSAMMSSRFVRGAMIDDDKTEVPLDAEVSKQAA